MIARARERRGGVLFALVLGFLLGILAASLADTDDGDTIVSREADAGADTEAASGGEISDEASTPLGDTSGTPTAEDGGRGAAATGGGATGSAAGARPAPGASGTTLPGARTPQPVARGGATARGVTANKIKVGVAHLDLTAFRAISEKYYAGDQVAQFTAMVKAMEREGVLPVHGRTIEFGYRKYTPTIAEEERAACVGLVRDENAFAVIGHAAFRAGAECVAREYKTPVLGADGVPEEAYQRGAPFLFTLHTSSGRLLRNLMHWAHHRGLLKNKTIGVYYLNDAEQPGLVARSIKRELEKLGYTVAAEATTDSALGGPQDALAVQRFRAENVSFAILLTSASGFMQQAQVQGYKPTYVASDWFYASSDTAVDPYPPEQFDGSFAMTSWRRQEYTTGSLVPAARKCLADYQAHTGQRVDPAKQESEWGALSITCDLMRVFVQALRIAGPNLTPTTFSQALQQVKIDELAMHSPIAFGPGRYTGVSSQRTLQYRGSCKCYRVVVKEFAPFWVA